MTEPLKGPRPERRLKESPPRHRSSEHTSVQSLHAKLDSIKETTLPLARGLNERIARIGERVGTRTHERKGPPTPTPSERELGDLDVDLHDDDPSTSS